MDKEMKKEEFIRKRFSVVQIEQKVTGMILKFLGSLPYVTGIPLHFKRVKRGEDGMNEVLVSEEGEDSYLNNTIQTKLFDYLFDEKILKFKIVKRDLPIEKPRNKEYYHVLSKEWPMKYVPQKLPELTDEEKVAYKKAIGKYTKCFDSDQCFNFASILDKESNEPLFTETVNSKQITPIDHCFIKVNNRFSEEVLMKTLDQYLLTGYTLITRIEPCMMCAMALVHSRIKRVIFTDFNTKMVGAVNSVFNINNLNINHKYEVWKFDQTTDRFILIN